MKKTHNFPKQKNKKNFQFQSSAYLVFFMHCGFAMLSVGCVRARFSKHICILILLDACASAIGFFLVREALFFLSRSPLSSLLSLSLSLSLSPCSPLSLPLGKRTEEKEEREKGAAAEAKKRKLFCPPHL